MHLDDIAELRPFVSDGRLIQVPRRRGKRLALLDLLAQEFEPGRRYSEQQVNDAIRVFADDFVTLRRYLVDEGFLDRSDDSGDYWRAGGSVI